MIAGLVSQTTGKHSNLSQVLQARTLAFDFHRCTGRPSDCPDGGQPNDEVNNRQQPQISEERPLRQDIRPSEVGDGKANRERYPDCCDQDQEHTSQISHLSVPTSFALPWDGIPATYRS